MALSKKEVIEYINLIKSEKDFKKIKQITWRMFTLSLSKKETDVLKFVAQGCTTESEVSEAMNIAEFTAKNYLNKLVEYGILQENDGVYEVLKW